MSWENDENAERICPKTGRCVGPGRERRLASWTLPLVGLASLLWFLVRVIPKPSRVAYPCQQAAFPLASGFVVWLTGAVVSRMACRKAKSLADRGRYVAAGLFAALAVAAIWWAIEITAVTDARAAFVPIDSPNSPIGVGKGIYPGRVVWVHDPSATTWDGVTGYWWDDRNVNQQVVDNMVARALRTLTGQQDDAAAWDAVFRYFNRTHGAGDVGYKPGEKIAIKINLNPQGYGPAYDTGGGNGRMPSPQMIRSLLAQLFDKVHVSGADVTIYDASRAIADPLYNRIHGDANPNFQNVRFVANTTGNGRVGAVYDPAYPVHFANPSVSTANSATAYLPTCVTEAKYLIDMAQLSAHSMFGFTACGKNWFGSIYWRTGGGWTPSPLHNFGMRNNPMGSYNPIVDLIGHPQLGGKTLLYLVDGLYGSDNAITRVLRFSSFGNNWTASVFASQDSIAIDSVVLDFLRNEPLMNTNCSGQGVDNYLHEAALAGNPPSGSFYDPGSTGSRLASLGVHEHWNNAVDKQYSRNLGKNEGIELVTPSLAFGKTLYCPRPFQVGDEKYVGIALVNLDSVPATIQFTLADQTGVTVKGENITNPATRTIDPGRQLPILDTELFGPGLAAHGGLGRIKIESDVRNLTGFFMVFDGRLNVLDGAPLDSQAATSSVLPEIEAEGYTRIAIDNPDTETAQLTFQLVSGSGNILESETRAVHGYASYSALLFQDMFQGVSASPRDYVRVVSDKPVLAFQLTGKEGTYINALQGQNSAGGAQRLYCPQYVTGGQYRTLLSIVNLDSLPGQVTIRFISDDPAIPEAAETVPIPGQGKIHVDDPRLFRSLPPAPPGSVIQGYLTITADGVRLAGSVVFGDADRAAFSSALPLVATLQTSLIYCQLASDSTYWTGLAMVNPNQIDVSATMSLYGADGELEARTPVTIPAGGRKSMLLTEYFTELAGRNRSSGYIRVSANGGVVSFALFGTHNLSALSAIPSQAEPSAALPGLPTLVGKELVIDRQLL